MSLRALSLSALSLSAVLLVVCLTAQQALADGTRISLVAPGAEYRYRLDEVQLPAERYGQLALFDHDGAQNSQATRPALWQPLGAVPPGWPSREVSGAGYRRGLAPIASHQGREACDCKTDLGDSNKTRHAALYASHRFVLSPQVDLSRYSLLELRIAYRDGVRVYLNGRMVVSRSFPRTEQLRQSARATKGPEWEEFLVPVFKGMLVPGENVVSFEVRPGQHLHGVRLDASLSLREAGRVVRGPMVQRVQRESASIRFDTDLPSMAYVEYGASDGLGSRAESAQGTIARHHRVRLTGLAPGQAVHYRVVAAGHPGPIHVFHVPPEAPEPLRFAVYGDVRGGHRVHATIAASLLSEAIDFVIVTGDMVLRGSDEADWQRFFAVAGPLLARLPYYPVAGNHDTGSSGDERRRMSELFALWPAPSGRLATGAWHSFDVSGVHFVMLDSNHYRDEGQLAWLRQDLETARAAGVRAIFAAVHAGPYSRGLHQGHRYAAEHYVPLLSKYGVTLLFSGHDHLYQRGKAGGLDYIVSGGGGAPLYSVRCGKRGKPRCKTNDGMKHVAKVHHYLLVTVFPSYVSVCPKHVDRSPLEACLRYPTRPRR